MMVDETNDAATELHKIYTNDPILFQSYVNKKVTITTEDGQVHTGIVYTIDPVSESIILVQPLSEDGKRMHIKIVMKQATKNIHCSYNEEIVLPEMFVTPLVNFSVEELAKRKESVLKLLLENHFPVTETKGILHIEDTVHIEPPYRPENCICLNSIILTRIQNLLSRISD